MTQLISLKHDKAWIANRTTRTGRQVRLRKSYFSLLAVKNYYENYRFFHQLIFTA